MSRANDIVNSGLKPDQRFLLDEDETELLRALDSERLDMCDGTAPFRSERLAEINSEISKLRAINEARKAESRT
jgi:hypothetical protein